MALGYTIQSASLLDHARHLQPLRTPSAHSWSNALLVLLCVASGMLAAAEGDLDPNVGTNGVATIAMPFLADAVPAGMTPVPNGVAMVGAVGNGVCTDSLLVIATNDGFRTTQQVQTGSGDNAFSCVTTQANGDLVVAGQVMGDPYQDVIVVRFFPDGSRDWSFGTDGAQILTSLGAFPSASAICVTSDDSILVAGLLDQSNSLFAFVAKLTPAGELDPTFGTAGVMQVIGLPQSLEPTSIRSFADASILLCGKGLYAPTCAATRLLASGATDPTYATAGLFQSSTLGTITCTAIGADGTCALCGTSLTSAAAVVAELDPSGALSSTFGSGGVAMSSPAEGWDPAGCAISLDDSVVITGVDDGACDSASGFVARFTGGGQPDPAFGNDGVTYVMAMDAWSAIDAAVIEGNGDIAISGNQLGDSGFQAVTLTTVTTHGVPIGATDVIPAGHQLSTALAVAQVANGAMEAAATTVLGSVSYASLARCLPNGAVDPAFAAGGTALNADPLLTRIAAAAIAADGSAVFVGDNEAVTGYAIGLERFLPDGALDASFGAGGIAQATIPGGGVPYAILLQDDGGILVEGETRANGQNNIYIARFTALGLLDATFASAGVATPDLDVNLENPGCFALAVDDTRGIYFTGGSLDLTLGRLLANGTLDTSFGGTGMIALAEAEHPHLSIDSAGRILVAWTSDSTFAGPPNTTDASLQRVLPNGTFDAAFGSQPVYGLATATITGAAYWSCAGVASLPDGSTMLVGTTADDFPSATIGEPHDASVSQLAFVRFTASGDPDADFGTDGCAQTPAADLLTEGFACGLASGDEVVTASYSDWTIGFARVEYGTAAIPDTTPPTIAITAPTLAPSYDTATAVITIAGISADAGGVASITYTLSGATTASGPATGTDTWSLATPPLNPGVSVVTVTARDSAGNASSASLRIDFSSAAVPSAMCSAAGPATNQAAIPITLTFSQPVVGLSLAGLSTSNAALGALTGSGSTYALTLTALAPGPVTCQVLGDAAQSLMGTDNTPSAVLTIDYDLTAPVVAFLTPATTGTFTTSAAALIASGTATDASGIVHVAWTLSGATTLSGTTSGTTAWQLTVPTLNEGVSTLTVTALDGAGNQAASALTIIRTGSSGGSSCGLGGGSGLLLGLVLCWCRRPRHHSRPGATRTGSHRV